MLPSINVYLLIIQGVIFLLVLWFLNRNLFKPLLKVLQERDERTEGFLQKSKEMEGKAKETFAEYTEKLRQARKETLEIKKKHILEGVERREDIFGKVRQEISSLLEGIRGEISAETESARQSLYPQIETMGRAIAEKVLGRSVRI
jgi:F-type H+-transporting ATPase subunit b